MIRRARGGLAAPIVETATTELDVRRPNEMSINGDFATSYRALEKRMAALAKAEAVFFSCQIPALRLRWATYCCAWSHRLVGGLVPPAEAQARVGAGFRNCVSSLEDFILHLSVRSYLCGQSQAYHITDLSKGAMLVADAGD